MSAIQETKREIWNQMYKGASRNTWFWEWKLYYGTVEEVIEQIYKELTE